MFLVSPECWPGSVLPRCVLGGVVAGVQSCSALLSSGAMTRAIAFGDSRFVFGGTCTCKAFVPGGKKRKTATCSSCLGSACRSPCSTASTASGGRRWRPSQIPIGWTSNAPRPHASPSGNALPHGTHPNPSGRGSLVKMLAPSPTFRTSGGPGPSALEPYI
jgi:hypothetical protein